MQQVYMVFLRFRLMLRHTRGGSFERRQQLAERVKTKLQKSDTAIVNCRNCSNFQCKPKMAETLRARPNIRNVYFWVSSENNNLCLWFGGTEPLFIVAYTHVHIVLCALTTSAQHARATVPARVFIWSCMFLQGSRRLGHSRLHMRILPKASDAILVGYMRHLKTPDCICHLFWGENVLVWDPKMF